MCCCTAFAPTLLSLSLSLFHFLLLSFAVASAPTREQCVVELIWYHWPPVDTNRGRPPVFGTTTATTRTTTTTTTTSTIRTIGEHLGNHGQFCIVDLRCTTELPFPLRRQPLLFHSPAHFILCCPVSKRKQKAVSAEQNRTGNGMEWTAQWSVTSVVVH